MTRHWPSGTIVPIGDPLDPAAEDDILRLIDDHRQLGALCDMLECCADELPALPSSRQVERICHALVQLYEEGDAGSPPYPDVMRLYDTEDPLAAILMEQVHVRHLADATHAQDIVDALRGDLNMADRLSADTLGYMLRCFFDGCRQAMDCEELAILTLARHRLSKAARATLIDSLRLRAQGRRFAST